MSLRTYCDEMKFCLDTNPDKLEFEDVRELDSYFSEYNEYQKREHPIDYIPAHNTVAISAPNPTLTHLDMEGVRNPQKYIGGIGLHISHHTGCHFVAKNKNYSNTAIVEKLCDLYKKRRIVTNIDLRTDYLHGTDIAAGTNYGVNTNGDERYTTKLMSICDKHGIKVTIDYTTPKGVSHIAKTLRSLSYRLNRENPHLYCLHLVVNKKLILEQVDDITLERFRAFLYAMNEYVEMLDTTNKKLQLLP